MIRHRARLSHCEEAGAIAFAAASREACVQVEADKVQRTPCPRDAALPSAMLADRLISLLRPHAFRGKHRLLAPFAPADGEVEVPIFGYRMRLDLADFLQRSVFLGTYELAEVAIFRELLRPGMTFVDVGANVGYFSFLAASIVGTRGRVVAFEPSPYAIERMQRTVAANDLPQVEMVHAGLSDAEGTLPLFVPSLAGHHTPTMTAAGPQTVRVDVRVTTLDRMLDELAIDRVDVMKIDVEGHEPRAFRGGSAALRAGRVRDIVCEFNEEWLQAAGSSSDALDGFLRDAGFQDLTAGNPILHRGLNRHYRWAGDAGR